MRAIPRSPRLPLCLPLFLPPCVSLRLALNIRPSLKRAVNVSPLSPHALLRAPGLPCHDHLHRAVSDDWLHRARCRSLWHRHNFRFYRLRTRRSLSWLKGGLRGVRAEELGIAIPHRCLPYAHSRPPIAPPTTTRCTAVGRKGGVGGCGRGGDRPCEPTRSHLIRQLLMLRRAERRGGGSHGWM